MLTRDPGYYARAAILGELLWREGRGMPAPSLTDLNTAIGSHSARHHVDDLEAKQLVGRDEDRRLRLTERGRALAQHVLYRVCSGDRYSKSMGFPQPRYFAEMRLREVRATKPDEVHWLTIDMDGRLDFDAPMVGEPADWVLDDVTDLLIPLGVVRMVMEPARSPGAIWRLEAELDDGLKEAVEGRSKADAFAKLWEKLRARRESTDATATA